MISFDSVECYELNITFLGFLGLMLLLLVHKNRLVAFLGALFARKNTAVTCMLRAYTIHYTGVVCVAVYVRVWVWVLVLERILARIVCMHLSSESTNILATPEPAIMIGKREQAIDDDCFYYYSWSNNVVIAFGILSSYPVL